MRPKIHHGEEHRERVHKYAKRNGLRMPKAWSRVIREGLDAVESNNDETEQAD